MKIIIASDHAGYELKSQLIAAFPEHTWVDLGPDSTASVDYPDFAKKVTDEIEQIEKSNHVRGFEDFLLSDSFGVLICGTGQGMAIKANRNPFVRAALCWNQDIAFFAREHNNASILCLGAKTVNLNSAKEIFKVFLSTKFAGGRHQARVQKLF